MTNTYERVLAHLRAVGESSAAQTAQAVGVITPTAGVILGLLVADGYADLVPGATRRYVARLPEHATANVVERYAADVPDVGNAGVTDPAVLREIEAEKTWQLAGVLRATREDRDRYVLARDVDEARALMAAARQRVRDEWRGCDVVAVSDVNEIVGTR